MMDILNRNQRRSAVWRVAALLGLITAVFFTTSTSMHMAYSSRGSGEIDALRDSIENQKYESAAIINGLVQDTVRLSSEIEKIRANDAAQETINELEKKIVKLEGKVDRQERRLEECDRKNAKLEITLQEIANQ